MSDVVITRATVEDVDSIAPLLDAYRQFYKQDSDLTGTRAFLHERLQRDEAVVFVARIDGKAVGFTLLYPLFSSVRMRNIWLLNDLYVAEEARKHGVGRLLLDRAKQHGIETGAQRLELKTAITNTTAQSVYEGHGWIRDNEFYAYSLVL